MKKRGFSRPFWRALLELENIDAKHQFSSDLEKLASKIIHDLPDLFHVIEHTSHMLRSQGWRLV